MSETGKLTISLPRDLISFADKLSKERNTSRSRVIASALRELAQKRDREQMVEGYKAMAEQNREFAARALPLANEILPEWK